MNKLLIGTAVAAFACTFAPAIAQTTPPAGVASGTAPATAPVPQVRTDIRVMANREMTRDEMVGHIRKMFAMLDTNKDGFLTREEVDSFGGKMSAMHGDFGKRMGDRGMMIGDRGAVFDRLDTNHDGNISRQEFMAAHSERREQRVIVMRDAAPGSPPPGAPGGDPGMRMHMRHMGAGMHFGSRMFEQADANKDGRVSLAEAQAAALAHFDKADINHDGKITPDERQQMRQLRRERRQG